jgi:hypothetical protein
MSMNRRELVEKVYNEILLINSRDNESAVAVSDTFVKDFMSSQGYSEGDIKHAITILAESHKIFVMTIHKENLKQNIKRVEAYVVSEPSILHQLKLRFQQRLVEVYEKDKNKKLSYSRIIREFLTNISLMAGSPLGKLANITIMLNEYENLIFNHSEEYSEEWKEIKLNEVLKSLNTFNEKEQEVASHEPDEISLPTKVKASSERRAVNSPDFDKFQEHSETLSPEKVLRIYGPTFFFRVKLRKYEFLYLAEIIEKGYIKQYRELVILKDMLKTIKGNFERDKDLSDHFEEIYKLDRVVSRALFHAG